TSTRSTPGKKAPVAKAVAAKKTPVKKAAIAKKVATGKKYLAVCLVLFNGVGVNGVMVGCRPVEFCDYVLCYTALSSSIDGAKKVMMNKG
ncbi:hypothetical protein Tco_1511933, partial [Tanacetum coccineum]